MIIVPTLAIGKDSSPPQIARIVGNIKCAIAPHMGDRINHPSVFTSPKHLLSQINNQPAEKKVVQMNYLFFCSELRNVGFKM
jgi:hypothetical protein